MIEEKKKKKDDAKKKLIEVTQKKIEATKKKRELTESLIVASKQNNISEEKKQELSKQISILEEELKQELKEVAELSTLLKKEVKDKEKSTSFRGRSRGIRGLRIRGGRGSRGRGSRGGRGRAYIKDVMSSMTLDNRTTSFRLSGMPEGNLNVDLLKEHFMQYGKVVDVTIQGSDAIIKMDTRKEAQQALAKGSVINDFKPRISWYMEPSKINEEEGEIIEENIHQNIDDGDGPVVEEVFGYREDSDDDYL